MSRHRVVHSKVATVFARAHRDAGRKARGRQVRASHLWQRDSSGCQLRFGPSSCKSKHPSFQNSCVIDYRSRKKDRAWHDPFDEKPYQSLVACQKFAVILTVFAEQCCTFHAVATDTICIFGCGSKMRTQNGALVNGAKD